MPQKMHCAVKNIVDHGERVYSVFLRPDSPVPRFLPGQFLHLALDLYQPGDFWPDSRAFSIASPPAQKDELSITYAVKGQFTTRMESELHLGGGVWTKLPYGEFSIQSDPGSACLLAGGTGVTAFTAFLADLEADAKQHVHIFYGARLPGLLIYRALVEASVGRCPNLHATFLAEQFADGTDCIPGRINLDTVWSILPDPLSVKYYIAGPPAMLSFLTEGLKRRKIQSRNIVIDAWE
jgi:ferredoxin-NADP reductase